MTTLHTPRVSPSEETVTVKLWEAYLRYNNAYLYKILSEMCVENATTPEECVAERVTFRFSRNLWEHKVRHILHENRIPVTVRASRPTSIRTVRRSRNWGAISPAATDQLL